MTLETVTAGVDVLLLFSLLWYHAYAPDLGNAVIWSPYWSPVVYWQFAITKMNWPVCCLALRP